MFTDLISRSHVLIPEFRFTINELIQNILSTQLIVLAYCSTTIFCNDRIALSGVIQERNGIRF